MHLKAAAGSRQEELENQTADSCREPTRAALVLDGDSSTTDTSQLGISGDYISGGHYVIQPHDGDTEDSLNDPDDTNGSKESFREQDIYLPIANVARIMKIAIRQTGKIAKDAKECVQECVSEFISFITSEASFNRFQCSPTNPSNYRAVVGFERSQFFARHLSEN
ncbi:hypothetical protein XELAEV_18036492mg [Xenopus laevis]|uniref:Transcription factor CBF/NF-Y/archaeal histone domain-containing protein n=1 Tax=Xenopus laevis TaxID=8355 RepID=A0A974CIW4_XENLA|nr:hypothetical protein XELAEV_18036492mg [Xenopus laevis]